MLLALNKPYGTLSQFTLESDSRWRTLAELGLPPHVYPLGRLDADSEGLLLLTDEAALNERFCIRATARARDTGCKSSGVPTTRRSARLATGVRPRWFHAQPCRWCAGHSTTRVLAPDRRFRFRKNWPTAGSAGSDRGQKSPGARG